MHALLEPELWAALFTLAALEIVLGIDNIIFLSIMANKLPEAQRPRARVIGLAGACITRILLLLSLAWLAKLTAPLFHLGDWGVSGRDIRSEEHTSELQSLMRISYAVFCLKKKNRNI